jgi:chromosome partitioning protein
LILMIGGEKGGVGKTTIATHMAVARKTAGRSVVLVDADPQGTASVWADARKAWIESRAESDKDVPLVPCVTLRGPKVHVELKELAQHYDDVVVDTGGADSQEFRSAMLGADMLLLPLKPGSFDFWTLTKMVDVVSMADTFNEGLQAVVCVSQVPSTARERAAKEARAVLEEMPRFTMLKTMIGFRAAFYHCSGDGLVVSEMKNPDIKARSEIAFLHEEIYGKVAA